MSKTPTQLKDLAVGDLISTDIVVNITDVADPKSKTGTTAKIKKGQAVRRICLVLEPGETGVQVTYVATFGESTTLPATLDKTMWYPFAPATQEGSFAPLLALDNGKAQWASLRTRHTITVNPVDKLSEQVPSGSAAAILGEMRA